MWIAPRATMRRILDAGPGASTWVLAALLGVSQALDQAANHDAGATHGLATVLGLSVVVGALAGPVVVLLLGALARWTGSWLGGTGSAAEVRAALAWGQVPSVTAIPLWIPVVLVGGREVFVAHPELADPAATLIVLVCGLAMAGSALWGAVTTVLAVAEAHRIAAWRSFVATLLALIFLAVAVGAPVALLGILASRLAGG
jgi:hypothetical protein